MEGRRREKDWQKQRSYPSAVGDLQLHTKAFIIHSIFVYTCWCTQTEANTTGYTWSFMYFRHTYTHIYIRKYYPSVSFRFIYGKIFCRKNVNLFYSRRNLANQNLEYQNYLSQWLLNFFQPLRRVSFQIEFRNLKTVISCNLVGLRECDLGWNNLAEPILLHARFEFRVFPSSRLVSVPWLVNPVCLTICS